jgi:hypothetical protein
VRREHWGATFPDSAFLVGGLVMMSLLQLSQWPLTDGLVNYLSPDFQIGLFACFLVGSVVCLAGLAITRREALAGGWIQAGGLIGIEIGLGVYTYLLATYIEGWYVTPTAWLLFGLMAMFASRCIRVVIFTVNVFRQARREVTQEQRRP